MRRLLYQEHRTTLHTTCINRVTVALCFELNSPEISLPANEFPELWRIRSFSIELVQNVLNNSAPISMSERQCLQCYQINSVKNNLPITHSQYTQVLYHHTKLAQAYFSSYSHNNANTEITIWHKPQSQNKWTKLTSVSLYLDSNGAAEIGFFRQGYRYSIIKNGSLCWLTRHSCQQSSTNSYPLFCE